MFTLCIPCNSVRYLDSLVYVITLLCMLGFGSWDSEFLGLLGCGVL